LLKIRRIKKILTLFKNSGGFEKSWRSTENQADLQNLGALQKKKADDRIQAGVKISAPGKKLAGLEKAGGPLSV
jgi:hypothetical protein